MTKHELAAVVRGLAPVLGEYFTIIGQRLAALEVKEKGLDGQPGKDGERGPVGAEGQTGRDGRDGQPGSPGVPGFDGKDGKDGTHGNDGRGFDDLKHITVVQDETKRHFTFRYVKGDVKLDFGTFTVPAQMYQGKWVAGTAYHEGDSVTWDGSEWHTLETTTAKPGQPGPASRAWTLKVKHGEQGKPGPEGKPGRDGRDLTNMDTKGTKW